MNLTQNSFNDHLNLLYNETSLHELILYYFLIYILIKLIGKVLKYDISKGVSNFNFNLKIMFIFILVLLFETITKITSLIVVQKNLLNNIVVSGTILILFVMGIRYIIKFLFYWIHYSDTKNKLSEKIKGRNNIELDFNKIKRHSKNSYQRLQTFLIQLIVDLSILIIFIIYYWKQSSYFLMIIVTILTSINFYYSMKENLLMVLESEGRKLNVNNNDFLK